jgi:U3 small nucleolar RNA-associated protein 12
MVKSYLRYEPSSWFGVVASGQASAARADGCLAVPALERVLLYNTDACTVSSTLSPFTSDPAQFPPAEVTALCLLESLGSLAAGYADGAIRIFRLPSSSSSPSSTVHIAAHSAAVTCIAASPSPSAFIASGSADTTVAVFDASSGAGIVSLRGHTAPVLSAIFVSGIVLATSGRDAHIRLWDLQTEHCVQTVTSHREEVHSLTMLHNCSSKNYPVLASCSRDGSVRMFDTADASRDSGSTALPSMLSLPKLNEIGEAITVAHRKGSRMSSTSVHITAVSGKKSKQMQMQSELVDFLALLLSDREIAVYRARSPSEASRHARRRVKRFGKDPSHASIQANDMIVHVCTAKAGAKVRGLLLEPSSSKAQKRRQAVLSLSLTLNNNTVELHEVARQQQQQQQKEAEKGNDGRGRRENQSERHGIVHYTASRAAKIELAGHRSDVRTCSLSSDDTQLLTAANGSAKVWNARSGAYLRTVECGYGLCSVFAPGNRFALVGCKDGELDVLDVEAGLLLERIEAHSGALWSMALLPSGNGLVTGAADRSCKLWEWVVLLVDGENEGSGRKLSLQLQRTLELSDDVLSVRVTPDGKLLLAALLDCTVRAYFMDTFKPFLAFYGHNLPVLSMDISYDSMLLATGSADKDIRIWGLDFGDCHKSLFAHDDSVMAVSFVPQTHYLFTVGKDKVLRHWDADKREMLLELRGHHAELWALAVSTAGDLLVTAGHDKSIRLWVRTGEPFFLEEEKEKRLESMFEDNEAQASHATAGGGDNARVLANAGVTDAAQASESALAGKRSRETLSAVDNLVEALDLASQEQQREREDNEAIQRGTLSKANVRKPNPLLLGRSPNEHVLQAVACVKASELEQALLVLPFASVLELLKQCTHWLEQGIDVELSCRVATLLLRLHQPQLSTSQQARPVLLDLSKHLRPTLIRLRDSIGENVAAMRSVKAVKRL